MEREFTVNCSTAELHRNEEDNESLFSLVLRMNGERFFLHRNAYYNVWRKISLRPKYHSIRKPESVTNREHCTEKLAIRNIAE